MMTRRLAALVVALAPTVLPSILGAQLRATPRPTPSRLGFSAARLTRLDSVFQHAVERGEIAGAVVLVLRDGQTAYERAFGWADREAGRRMTPDAIFRIASQTKALTSVAIMMLAEEGRLGINDPVSRHLPSFRQTMVATRADTGVATVPARRAITIRDLLAHTAGIGYGTDTIAVAAYAAKGLGRAAGGQGWYTADKDEPICATVERLATLPFVAQPGERWTYGYATDVLGCVVERVSGQPLDEFVRTRITAPLRMNDTHFFLPPEKQGRLTAVYASTDTQVVRAADGARGQGHYAEGPRRSFSGGAGLVSTARDYARFLQMLLNGGTLDGARLLAPRTVTLMTTDQAGMLYPQPGAAFGLGFSVLQRAGAEGRVESVGTYGWGGAYGSTYAVDPAERLVMILMIQQLPNTSDIAGRFPMLVYQALVEPRQPAAK
jgi:CubicO group peptidase (beta-lactamase class C family)